MLAEGTLALAQRLARRTHPVSVCYEEEEQALVESRGNIGLTPVADAGKQKREK